MYIGMHHLQKLCVGKKHKLIRADVRYGLTGYMNLKAAPIPYNVHLIYIAYEAVSYTHLDVYKRQILHILQFTVTCTAAVFTVSVMMIQYVL